MGKFHIVTDSAARFSQARHNQDQPITVLPYKLDVGGRWLREDVDISAQDVLALMAAPTQPPRLFAPSIDDYAQTFTRLSAQCDGILAITASRELSASWQHARTAAHQVAGRCQIDVVDSRSVCVGQGMLVRRAAERAAERAVGGDFGTWVQHTRGDADRIYSVYYVSAVSALQRNGLLSVSHSILADVLEIKPCLSMEEGRLMVIEKVRTRSQAVERLVEFLVEFEGLDDVSIIQPSGVIGEDARLLQERLTAEFPGQHFPFSVYGALLASYIGSTATGVVVLESEHHDDL